MPSKDLAIHDHQVPRIVSQNGVNLREDTLYTDPEGQEKSGVRKRNEKALEQLQEALPRVLQPDEVVLYVARGDIQPTFGEQFTFGWYVIYITGSALVFTNRRILRFMVKPGLFGGRDAWTWRRSLRSVAWGDVAEAKVSGLFSATLKLRYRNGKTEKFARLRREDGKKIRLLAEKILSGAASENTAAQGMAALCPRCFAVLQPDNYECAQCRMPFKDKATAVRRSLLIPGGGYFYTGHTFLGVMDSIAEGFLTLIVLLLVLEVLGVTAPGPDEPPATWGLVIFVLVLLGIEKLFTIHHANRFIRDFIPAE